MYINKIAIMQPYFFPYIGYFQLINAVDKFVIYDDVNFIKGGYINRNNIISQGTSLRINVLLRKASSFKKINEIDINNQLDWRKKLVKQIFQSYSKAPHFNEVNRLLDQIINKDIINIAEFLSYSIKAICEFIGIDTAIVSTSTIYNNQELERKDRIIDICNKENSFHYINALGGKELYSKEEFIKENVKLEFIQTKPLMYKQFKYEFVPNLSIIDVLMFNTKDEVKKMLNQYKLT